MKINLPITRRNQEMSDLGLPLSKKMLEEELAEVSAVICLTPSAKAKFDAHIAALKKALNETKRK